MLALLTLTLGLLEVGEGALGARVVGRLAAEDAAEAAALVLEAGVLDSLHVRVEVVLLLLSEGGLALGVALLLEHAVELDGLLPLLLARLRHGRQVARRLRQPVVVSSSLLKLSITLWDGSIDAESVLHLLLGG